MTWRATTPEEIQTVVSDWAKSLRTAARFMRKPHPAPKATAAGRAAQLWAAAALIRAAASLENSVANRKLAASIEKEGS